MTSDRWKRRKCEIRLKIHELVDFANTLSSLVRYVSFICFVEGIVVRESQPSPSRKQFHTSTIAGSPIRTVKTNKPKGQKKERERKEMKRNKRNEMQQRMMEYI